VSKEEALQYLKCRGIDEEQAAEIHELIGGRMIHIKTITDEITRGSTLEKMRNTMFDTAESQLKSAKVFPGYRYHKEGAAIIRELLEKGSISQRTFYGQVGVDTGNKFLETNVFAFHFDSGEITFQSTLMKRYCEKHSTDWESDLRTENQADGDAATTRELGGR
jgi:hypothetical protein